MATNSGWILDPERNDYYIIYYNAYGQQTGFQWASQQAESSQQPHQQLEQHQQYSQSQTQPYTAVTPDTSATRRPRIDSQYGTQAATSAGADEASPAPPVPFNVREQEAQSTVFIAGTPQEGWYDKLDSSYRMRTGTEARGFFVLGRVFAMLYTEPVGQNAKRNGNNDNFTTVRFGEEVFTQIRRFVVVSVRRNFVHACTIATYNGQGTLKRGCDPREHSVVYNTGVDPKSCYFEGEKARGLYKEPIEVRPASADSYLTHASRIRFGHVYSIEWNVKVKDIGRVVASNLSLLTAHYDGENAQYPAETSY